MTHTHSGFTLVEISIVMIIIGLLIGGTFGGMQLVENMKVNKTVQDLKSIESAALSFKDTYGRLPGDLPSPSTRLPNCTTAPCSTAGNGDRTIGTYNVWHGAITNTDENFTFWHHLQAAGLVAMDFHNTTDMTFGEGQPSSADGVGYRVSHSVGVSTDTCRRWDRSFIIMTDQPSAVIDQNVSCQYLGGIDRKMDDGSPNSGFFTASHGGFISACAAVPASCNSPYAAGAVGNGQYDLRGF